MLLCTFEAIPGEFWSGVIWNWTEEEDLNKKLQATGLDSRIFMLSMGMPFYIFAVSLPFLLLAIILTCCTKNQRSDKNKDEVEGGSQDNEL